MKPQQESRGADNKSEYLIIYLQGCNKLACRLSPVQRATATAYRLHI